MFQIKDNKINIIMPNFNGEKYLKRAIESFLLQNYENKKLIIIDGKSVDKSHEIIKEFIKNDQIIWINEKDDGISSAINIGLSKTDADIVGYLGSDDILCKDILNKINYYFNILDIDAVSCNSITYYEKEKFYYKRYNPNIPFNKDSLLTYGTITGLQNIFLKGKLLRETMYDVNNRYSMDYEIYFRLVDKGIKVFYLDEIATVNIFDNNISYQLEDRQTEEAFKVALKYCKTYKEYLKVYKRKIRYLLNKIVKQ